jgi:type IV secretion system protein VirB3
MPEEGREILYLAITRPAMKLGVPVEGLCLNLLACYLAFLWTAHANPLTLRGVACIVMLPIVHFAMRLLVSIDHNLFRIIRLAAETRGLQVRGVSVLWAMSWKRPIRAKDQASAV